MHTSKSRWNFGVFENGVTLDSSRNYESTDEKYCILLSTGAINPPHFGHVDMMTRARREMKNVGFHVLHSYISPSHDDYVTSKAVRMGTTYANAAHRCQLLEHCIAEYILLYDRAEEGKPVITVGHWESQQSTFEDFDVVAMSLLAEMREFYREIRGVSSIKVMYVCGEDHAEKCFLSRGFAHPDIGVVIIPRESPSRRACIIESNPARNVYVASATDRSGMNFSSTELRLALASLILDSENDLRNSRPAQIFGLSCLEYCRLNHVYLPPPEGIRIVHISDTHNFLVDASSLQLPPGDVLVHTGDFSNSGTVEEFRQFENWLRAISPQYSYRIIVFGNHDVRVFKDDFEAMAGLLPSATHILNSESVVIKGVKFYGSHWLHSYDSVYRFKGRGNDVESASIPSHHFNRIPVDTDILLTHGPAYNLHDFYDLTFHSGSAELLEALDNIDNIAVIHLHGHIHESYGHSVTPLSKGTRLITCNSAICDTCTRCLHYKPHTISIPLLLQPHGIEPELYDFNRTVVSEDGVLSRSHY